MAVTYTPSNQTIYETIRQLVITTSGITGTRVVWTQNPGPLPSLPYAVLSVLADGQTDSVDETRYEMDDEIAPTSMTERMVGTRQITVSVNIHTLNRGKASAPSAPAIATDEAMDTMRKVQASLYAQTVMDALNSAGIGFVSSSEAIDLSEVVGDAFEKRAQTDMVFSYVVVREDDTANWVDTIDPPILDFEAEV